MVDVLCLDVCHFRYLSFMYLRVFKGVHYLFAPCT